MSALACCRNDRVDRFPEANLTLLILLGERIRDLHQSKSITDKIGVLYERVTGVKCRPYPSLCFCCCCI